MKFIQPINLYFLDFIKSTQSTLKHIQLNPRLSSILWAQSQYGLVYCGLSALSAPLGYYLNESVYFYLFSLPMLSGFQIKKIILSVLSPSYMSEDNEGAEILNIPTKTPISLKDLIILNLTHPLLLTLVTLPSLSFIFNKLIPLNLLSSLITTSLSAYFTGFLLWQYACVRDGFTPNEIILMLTGNPLKTAQLGMSLACLDLILSNFIWGPLAKSLYALAYLFAMIHANQLSATSAGFAKKRPYFFDPIPPLWTLNQWIFAWILAKLKGPDPNPNLGKMWAEKVNQFKLTLMTKFNLLQSIKTFEIISPIINTLIHSLKPLLINYLSWISGLKLPNLKISKSIFPECLAFMVQDLTNSISSLSAGIKAYESQIHIVQILLKTPFLKHVIKNIALVSFGNTLTQAATFLLDVTTPGCFTKYLDKTLSYLPQYSSQALPGPSIPPKTSALIQQAIATPLDLTPQSTTCSNTGLKKRILPSEISSNYF